MTAKTRIRKRNTNIILMNTKNCQKDKDFYLSPMVDVIEVIPLRIICGSNENIVPGEETEW